MHTTPSSLYCVFLTLYRNTLLDQSPSGAVRYAMGSLLLATVSADSMATSALAERLAETGCVQSCVLLLASPPPDSASAELVALGGDVLVGPKAVQRLLWKLLDLPQGLTAAVQLAEETLDGCSTSPTLKNDV